MKDLRQKLGGMVVVVWETAERFERQRRVLNSPQRAHHHLTLFPQIVVCFSIIDGNPVQCPAMGRLNGFGHFEDFG